LAATLAVATALPYGIKGGYDRDNDQLVQSHIPVNDNLNADRLELSQARKTGRSSFGGGASVVEPIEGFREREDIIQGRPLSSIRRENGRITEIGRPIGGGQSDIIVGRPINGGQSDIIVGRPIRGGHDDIIVARPIGGGHGHEHGHDHGSIIVAKPIGGGHDYGQRRVGY